MEAKIGRDDALVFRKVRRLGMRSIMADYQTGNPVWVGVAQLVWGGAVGLGWRSWFGVAQRFKRCDNSVTLARGFSRCGA